MGDYSYTGTDNQTKQRMHRVKMMRRGIKLSPRTQRLIRLKSKIQFESLYTLSKWCNMRSLSQMPISFNLTQHCAYSRTHSALDLT